VYTWAAQIKTSKIFKTPIANDFPKEIDEIHQKLYPVLKETKKTGQRD